MRLREVAPVADGDLPLAALKDQLRLGSGFADEGGQDAVLRGWLRAALAAVERRLDKALISRSFILDLPGWSDAEAQVLPIAPVSAITEVKLFDAGGASSVLDGARWRLVADAHRPRLEGQHLTLPVLPKGGRVEITLTAGFGSFAQLPPDLRQAVLMLAALYHDHRHEGLAPVSAMPFGVAALLEPWRVVRSFGGRR